MPHGTGLWAKGPLGSRCIYNKSMAENKWVLPGALKKKTTKSGYTGPIPVIRAIISTSNPYKWPLKWAIGVITLLMGAKAPSITAKGWQFF